MPVIRYPADLPITARREEILAAIRDHQVVILAGETGSGKTTQLPKMCLEALGENRRGKIGCTQPRRVAAMSVSKRVAEELSVSWGREVGCKMRFNDDTSKDTLIKFMTDGILLAEIQGNPMLNGYSMLILDEAHERSLNIDFLLGYLKGLLAKRPDLKLLVTSATIDTAAFSAHFGNAPIIEVSGRLYPVDIRYSPLGAGAEEQNHIEAAVTAVEDVLIESQQGDVLVFMPTERDIRETRDLLDGRLGKNFEVLALYGRMAGAEQQRIFSPGAKRRVVIATNVAETSITIPRIRYVIDTGLARMSRYNPRTRTKRLPIEPVSQSSANQRAGRAGRVQDGICIRLYTEEDFVKRTEFTQPEIQRANLAEVILRMKAFKLGDIESFPFINPPVSAAITSGYQLLHELGALSDTNDMTGMGRDLARLPVDPTLGRMLLQAKKEDALPEVLVIAAGMSIPDPRERPEDAREQAAAAHKAYWCPDSDFLSLLRLWKAAPDPVTGSLNQLRKFCKGNYLSLTRMREWRDIWRQLGEALEDSDNPLITPPEREQSNDPAVHRSILAGHIGHIATKEERNLYKAAGNRQVTLFPGSNLYERREKAGKPKQAGDKDKPKQPQWIVAGEIVQTSQLFARTVARIDPAWITDLAAHLIQNKYSEPQWQEKTGRVLVMQRSLLHGLEVARQQIDYGKVNPAAATEMFIRHALLQRESHIHHPFHLHNQKLRDKLETTLSRMRSNQFFAIEEALYDFYLKHLKNISSVHDLNRVITEKRKQQPDFLFAKEEDLAQGDEVADHLALFPDTVPVGNSVLPITYAYKPGQEDDGVTVRVPLSMAPYLTEAHLQWMVPGLREEQISVLLRALPKSARRTLMPLEPKVTEIANTFQPEPGDFLKSLAAFLNRKYGLQVNATDWPAQSLPTHLQPRIEVVDGSEKTVIAARDLATIRAGVKQTAKPTDAWDKTARRIERYALISWSFGDLLERLHVEDVGGVPLFAYPGLVVRDGEVDLRLFRSSEEALEGTPEAIRKLAENALGRDVAWLQKELKSFGLGGKSSRQQPASFQDALSQLQRSPAAPAAVVDSLPQIAFDHVMNHVLKLEPLHPLKESRFTAMCAKAKTELPIVTHRTQQLYRQVHELKDAILKAKSRYPGLENDVARLVPANLLAATPHAQLQHLPRYLKAVQIRAERAANNPAKDNDKAVLIDDFKGWEKEVPVANYETFRWLFEEYRVSIFAQELGTAQPASVKRLEALIGD